MDTETSYRTIIKTILRKYAQLRPSHGNIRLDVVLDELNDRYALMQVGWDRGIRVRGNLLYLALDNGKIVVEYDGLEQGIAGELVAAGVDPDDIVLAYVPTAVAA
jgi:hypothetical protein